MKHKLPVVEPRDSADFPTAAQDFRDKLNDPSASGAVFLAVCRCFAQVQCHVPDHCMSVLDSVKKQCGSQCFGLQRLSSQVF